MRTISNAVGLFFLLIVPLAASAASSEIHFTPDGRFSAKNILVYQRSGSNLFCRATWGDAFIRFGVLINASTTISKNHGESAVVSDIGDKDLIDVEGTLATGADSIVINASHIRDASLERESKVLSGTVKSIAATLRTLELMNKTFKQTTVSVSESVPITKGVRTIDFADIKVGDKVVSAEGIYDYQSKIFYPNTLPLFQDAAVFTSRNFQGVLKNISGVQLPVTLVVTVEGTDYTVYLGEKGIVLNTAKSAASLSRFVIGDKIRFFGAIRQSSLTEVDAEVVRDLNF